MRLNPPYNSHKWDRWVTLFGIKPKKMMPYHPPTNRMVERFNQNLKLVILASYASDKTQRKKWTSMWQYTVTRHTLSREKSGANSCLTGTKLPRLPFKSREHHKNARKQDKEAKDLV